MTEKNYYEEIIEEIKNIAKEDKEKAILILKKELAMPYIQENYEKEMKELLDGLEEGGSKNIPATTREEILEVIEKESQNDSRKMFLLNEISKFNWVGYEEKIEKILSNKKIKNNIKTIFFETLIQQKMDFDFKFEEKKYNPKNMKSIFQSDFVIENVNRIEKNDEIKDLVIKRISIETLLIYVSHQFPNSINIKNEDISKDLIAVSNILLGNSSNEKLSKIGQEILHIISIN